MLDVACGWNIKHKISLIGIECDREKWESVSSKKGEKLKSFTLRENNFKI